MHDHLRCPVVPMGRSVADLPLRRRSGVTAGWRDARLGREGDLGMVVLAEVRGRAVRGTGAQQGAGERFGVGQHLLGRGEEVIVGRRTPGRRGLQSGCCDSSEGRPRLGPGCRLNGRISRDRYRAALAMRDQGGIDDLLGLPAVVEAGFGRVAGQDGVDE